MEKPSSLGRGKSTSSTQMYERWKSTGRGESTSSTQMYERLGLHRRTAQSCGNQPGAPDHWLSACIARYPCLKGSPSLTWPLLLILPLGCSSHPTSEVSQFLFPSWAWQPRHSFPRAAPIWAMDLCPIPKAQTPRASSLSWCQNRQQSQEGRPGVCGETDLKEKRWGWRGQQSQISKVLRTSIRSLGFNGVGF